jgi:asparagine N-glycosylation enzyme membrane subunit Stt3
VRGSARFAWMTVAGLALVLGVGLAVRLASWRTVFGGTRVQFLIDSDAHYHALRARQLVEAYPSIPLVDPLMNYPLGARIVWPPLFDMLSAWPAAWLGRPDLVEPIAAVLPVAFGVLTLPLVYLVGAMVASRRVGLLATLVLALLPAHVEFTLLGRVDQHAAELFFATWVFAAFLWPLRYYAPSSRTAWLQRLALGSGIALAAWNWQGSALNLALLAAFVATVHLLRRVQPSPRPAAILRDGAATGAILLLGSLLALQRGALTDFSMMGVTGFHVAVVAMTAAGAAVLAHFAARPERSIARRAGEVAVAAALPAAGAAFAIPGFARSIGFAAMYVTAKNAWLSSIDEFGPLLFSGSHPLTHELGTMLERFGLALCVLPVCGYALWKARSERPEQRERVEFVLFWGAIFAVLTAVTVRFSLYVSVPAALWIAVALDRISRRLESGRALAGRPVLGSLASVGTATIAAIALLAPGARSLMPGWFAPDFMVQRSVPVLRWLTEQQADSDRDAVLASWTMGHAIRYHAGKPVVATPFGTDGGERAMDDYAQFFAARTLGPLEDVADRRRIAWVLLTNPLNDVWLAEEITGVEQRRALVVRPDRLRGNNVVVDTTALTENAAARLYFLDGSSTGPGDGGRAAGRFRLMFETPSWQSGLDLDALKLFGVVSGALVEVRTSPFKDVAAEVVLRTNTSRTARWTDRARADESGRATVRVPYQTGWNGAVWAAPCVVSDGTVQRVVALSASDVTEGATTTVDLAAP